MLTCNEQEKRTTEYWDDCEWGSAQIDDTNPPNSEDTQGDSWWSDDK